MKKTLMLFILPIFLFGCNNFFNDETNVKVSANLYQSKSTRSLTNLGDVTNIEVWISDPGVNYQLVDNPSPIKYFVTDEDAEIDLDAEAVRNFSAANSPSISFDIKTDVQKNITLRVTYDSGRIFIGTVERSVNQYTTEIEVDIYETASSKTINYFSELDDFLDTWE